MKNAGNIKDRKNVIEQVDAVNLSNIFSSYHYSLFVLNTFRKTCRKMHNSLCTVHYALVSLTTH